MDRVFQPEETGAYEQWLEGRTGGAWLRGSNMLLDKVLDWRPGWRVLDIGCGLGVNLEHLVGRGLLGFGLEAGPVMARLASQRLGQRAEVQVGDACDLPFEDNSFDAVVMVNTLELIERRAQALAEAARVAASRICVLALNPLSPLGLAQLMPGPRHPLHQGRPLGLWSLLRMVREVLGPVPYAWSGAVLWPRPAIGRWPLATMLGVCAAVTPRYMTTPLTAEAAGPAKAPRPAHSAGRVSLLHRVK